VYRIFYLSVRKRYITNIFRLSSFQAKLNESNTLLNFLLFVCYIFNPFLVNMERNSSLNIGTGAVAAEGGGGVTPLPFCHYLTYHFIASHLITVTEIETLSISRQLILKFRCETSIGYESRKCMQAVQGGLLGGHKSPLVNYILFPPSLQLPTYNKALPGIWPGRYMRTDSP
jgi:hypothetical protein